ncbi:MAG TPA: HAMP domain-containing sensor histidine kinase [Bacillota bacterium]|nr:HAMP domain-containing sensor histidine kinase [Bacillota bacterium]
MLRNREIRILFIIKGVISLIAIISGFFMSNHTGWLILTVVAVLLLVSLIFTRWRYREIEKLINYLREISSGNYSLDVRDNAEGELSVLKNEIYKVTTILSEHTAHLESNKHHLTNAISDISHQIKTPLTSMVVMADLLDEPHLPMEKRREFIQNIHTQLERLNWLVTSLLKLSKLDSGTVQFKRDSVNLNKLLKQSVESLSVPIDVKQQTVTVEGDEEISLINDREWTKEAFINILKNCIEHTPEKEKIVISFKENVLYTEVLITDNGPGIAQEDLPYIFQRFYKGKHASDQSVGIGLALAYRIITDQGGDLEVLSEKGHGTQFSVKFYDKNLVKV